MKALDLSQTVRNYLAAKNMIQVYAEIKIQNRDELAKNVQVDKEAFDRLVGEIAANETSARERFEATAQQLGFNITEELEELDKYAN
jgi:parvulin-like peptidyl-prolyl isomerase